MGTMTFHLLIALNCWWTLTLSIFLLHCSHSVLPFQVAFFLFLSLSVYTVLPLSMAWALMVGIWTSVSHIVIISVYVPVTSPETQDLAVQVRQNALALFKVTNKSTKKSLWSLQMIRIDQYTLKVAKFGPAWLWLSIKSEKNSFICKCRQNFANNPACVSSSFANHHANSNIMWDRISARQYCFVFDVWQDPQLLWKTYKSTSHQTVCSKMQEKCT